MSSLRFIRFAAACVLAGAAASASAQTALRLAEPVEARSGQATTPSPDAKGQPGPQGFSVVLVLGDGQSTTVADNVPGAARKALADMKDFLPYRGYRLLDAQWILGSQRSTSRLRGPDDQEYQLTLRTTQLAGGRVSVVFQLQESSALTMIGPRDAADETAARKAEEMELQARLGRLQAELAAMKQRLGDKHPAVASTAAEIENLKMRLAAFESGEGRPRSLFGGRSVIDTTFSMEIGETVVVGTSRMRGGDKALIALLTAVPRGGATTRKE
jgi:hypothetical protein